MAEAAKNRTSKERMKAVGEPAAKGPTAPTCTVGFCPICLAVTAVQPIRPDVIEHLLLAGREFLLAAKAVLETRADQADGSRSGSTLEKIDIG